MSPVILATAVAVPAMFGPVDQTAAARAWACCGLMTKPRVWRSNDPWIVGDGAVDLYAQIEDELILALPIVAYHDYACVDLLRYGADPSSADASQGSTPSQTRLTHFRCWKH